LGWLAGGLAQGRGEVGHGWVENWRWAKVQKEFIFELQLILEFGRTLENCTMRLRKKFDMDIFPKIFMSNFFLSLLVQFSKVLLKSSRLSKYFRKMKYDMP
jgi:hypothetical protein